MAQDDGRLAQVQRQFRRQADAYERLPAVNDPQHLSELVSLAGSKQNDHVLDVACGPGFLTMEFAAGARRVIGIDATDRFLVHASAEAERRGLTNVYFFMGDAEALPFLDGAFDLVVSRAAFHHFPQPTPALQEMMRVTNSEGHLLISDQLTSEEESKAEEHNQIERLCDQTHARSLPHSEFRELFEQVGLNLVSHRFSKFRWSLKEWITHGGPSPAATHEIERRMQASVETDRTGLDVRLEDGELFFSYTGAAYLLAKGY